MEIKKSCFVACESHSRYLEKERDLKIKNMTIKVDQHFSLQRPAFMI